MKSAVCLSALASAAIVTGCANGSAIYRKEALDKDSLVLDAKQRLVANYDAKPWEVDPAVTENRKYGPPRYIAPERIVCPEPSPDVAASLSSAITASLSQINADGSRTSGNMGYAAAESLAQLGQRLATTQLLRDELADLCRSYANGAISTTNYTLRLAQLDEKMVTLLTAEMIAGAFQRDSVAISGSTAFAGGGADGKASPELINAAKTEVTEAQADLQRKSEALTKALDETPKPDADTKSEKQLQEWANANAAKIDAHKQKTDVLRTDYRLAQERAQRAQNQLVALQDPVSSGTSLPTARALTLGGQAVSTYGGNAMSAQRLVDLQSNYLDRDKGGAIVDTCITRMNDDLLFPDRRIEEDNARKLQEDLVKQRSALQQAQDQLDRKTRPIERELLPKIAEARRKRDRLLDSGLRADLEAAEQTLTNLETQLRSRVEDADPDLYSRIQNLQQAIFGLTEQINFQRSGKSATQKQFDTMCYSLIDRFYTQTSLAQNARLELELKRMEADVQMSRSNWAATRERFCAGILDKYANSTIEQIRADPTVQSCLAPPQAQLQGQYLGNLTYRGENTPGTSQGSSATPIRSASTADLDQVLDYLLDLEATQFETRMRLDELLSRLPADDQGSDPESATEPDANGDL